MDSSHDYQTLSNPCIQAAVPPPLDPSLVDFREFYPYIPNEIKHRKRTTQAQLEVLEQTFAHDKKPNGVMRANLARQLDMTPRGVQVWFQNRRAKEKTLAKKAAAKIHQPQPPQADSPESQESAGANGLASLQRSSSTATDSNRPSISPSTSPPTVDIVDSSQDLQPIAPSIPLTRHDLTDPNHPINLRRGSLPIITRSTSDEYPRNRIPPTFDPLARRGSLGMDVSRLAAHPYAYIAAAANNGGGNNVYAGPGPVRGHRMHGSVKSNSLPGAKAADQYGYVPHSIRSIPSHRASMPYVFSQGTPLSMDTAFVPIKHSTPTFTSKYHDGLYSMPSRSIAEPIPGPLPNPNFSFGDSSASPPAPSPSTSESSEHLAALNNYAFPSGPDADQEEEPSPNVPYGPFSTRFSSIASLADSESSITSAFYSEPGSVDEYPADFHPHSRRQSHVLDHFSSLGIEAHVTVSPKDSVNNSPEQAHTNKSTSGMNTAYASPTGSNGDSPHPLTKPVQFILTSELASALSHNTDGSITHDGTERYTQGARTMNNSVISPPTLESAPLVGNVGRPCYENPYSAGSYSMYNDTFDASSKVGHYTVPPYGNGQSHGGLTNPTSTVSPVYSNQEPAVDVVGYGFGTSH